MNIDPSPTPECEYMVTVDYVEFTVLMAAVLTRLKSAATGQEVLSEDEATSLLELTYKAGNIPVAICVGGRLLGYFATCLAGVKPESLSNPNEIRVAEEMTVQFSLEEKIVGVNLVIPDFLSDTLE